MPTCPDCNQDILDDGCGCVLIDGHDRAPEEWIDTGHGRYVRRCLAMTTRTLYIPKKSDHPPQLDVNTLSSTEPVLLVPNDIDHVETLYEQCPDASVVTIYYQGTQLPLCVKHDDDWPQGRSMVVPWLLCTTCGSQVQLHEPYELGNCVAVLQKRLAAAIDALTPFAQALTEAGDQSFVPVPQSSLQRALSIVASYVEPQGGQT